MDETVTSVTEEKSIYLNMYQCSKLIGTYPQKIFYAIAKGLLIPYQTEPNTLIEKSELLRYAKEQNIEIPE